jgi:hypothetical protein
MPKLHMAPEMVPQGRDHLSGLGDVFRLMAVEEGITARSGIESVSPPNLC